MWMRGNVHREGNGELSSACPCALAWNRLRLRHVRAFCVIAFGVQAVWSFRCSCKAQCLVSLFYSLWISCKGCGLWHSYSTETASWICLCLLPAVWSSIRSNVFLGARIYTWKLFQSLLFSATCSCPRCVLYLHTLKIKWWPFRHAAFKLSCGHIRKHMSFHHICTDVPPVLCWLCLPVIGAFRWCVFGWCQY